MYVVDGDTGAYITSFDTSAAMLTAFNKYRGVIADMALVSGSDGHAKYAYIVDLGGNVFRITFTGAATAWTMTHIASLGCDTATAGCTANRKFMFAPSVVNTATGEYTIMVGSGDREKPITGYASATAVTNCFFQFKDKPDDATYPGMRRLRRGADCLASLYPIGRDATSPTTWEPRKAGTSA